MDSGGANYRFRLTAALAIAELQAPLSRQRKFDIYHRQIIDVDVLTGLREMMPGKGKLDDFRVRRAIRSRSSVG